MKGSLLWSGHLFPGHKWLFKYGGYFTKVGVMARPDCWEIQDLNVLHQPPWGTRIITLAGNFIRNT